MRRYPCDYLRHCVPPLYSLHTERSMIMSLIDSCTLRMSRLAAVPFSNIYVYICVGSVCPDFIRGYYGFTQLAIRLFVSLRIVEARDRFMNRRCITQIYVPDSLAYRFDTF